jgi:hypothetical protein
MRFQRVGGSIPSRRTDPLVTSILEASFCRWLLVNSRKSMARKVDAPCESTDELALGYA